MSVPLPSVTVYAGGSAPRLAWDQWLPSLRDPKMSWWPRSRKRPPVRGAHRATSRRHLSTAGRATAPVRRRFHPEEKTASPSPSVRPGGRTPTTLTRRLLGIGVTHVTTAPGRTDPRKKSPASRGAGTQGGIECVPSCDGNGGQRWKVRAGQPYRGSMLRPLQQLRAA